MPILKSELNRINNSKQENQFFQHVKEKCFNDIKDNKIALLRIGMHSGDEAVTIEVRKIKKYCISRFAHYDMVFSKEI